VYFAKLLEIIQLQRHDFLNHLQVISGFQQLNKPDRIQEYVKQVTVEIAEMSKTTCFKMPEVTAAVLAGFYEASKYEFKIELTVNSTLGDCEVPGPVAGGALESVFNCIFANIASPATGERYLKIKFSEHEHEYSISFKSNASCINDQETFRKSFEPANELLNEYGGQLNIIFSRGIFEIILGFPRKTTASDHKRLV
jgi:sensor histidine kinase regulating citrate/malate metabolism